MKTVFIHGYCDSLHEFDYLKTYFPGSVAFDLPGFGKTVKPKIRYDKEVFLNALKEHVTEPSILVGFSMGAMVARDFALKYPSLVKKLFLISYPPQKNRELLREGLRRRWISRQYVDKTLAGKILCNTHNLYRWVALLQALVFRPRYIRYVNGWFRHTYHVALSAMQDYILKDDPKSTLSVKDKTIVIVGEHEPFNPNSLLPQFRHYIVPGMGHPMAGHEDEIAKIIQENI